MNRRTALLILLAVGAISSAVAVRSALEKHNHSTAQRHLATSDALEKQGKIQEAIAELKLALADDPKYFDARQGLSDIYESQNQFTEALAVLNEGLRLSPADDERYRYGLCVVYKSQHDYPNAILEIRQGLKEAPGDPNDLRMLGMLLERTKQYGEAEKMWADYARLHPSDVSGQHGLDRVRRLEARNKSASAGGASGANHSKSVK